MLQDRFFSLFYTRYTMKCYKIVASASLAAKLAGLPGNIVLLASNIPPLATNGRGSPEHVLRVNLALDLCQALIVGAIERLLELRIHEVTLVTITTSTRADVLETLSKVVGELDVGGGTVGLGSLGVPDQTDDGEHEVVAPGRVGSA